MNEYGQLKLDGEKATLEASEAHMILRFEKSQNNVLSRICLKEKNECNFEFQEPHPVRPRAVR